MVYRGRLLAGRLDGRRRPRVGAEWRSERNEQRKAKSPQSVFQGGHHQIQDMAILEFAGPGKIARIKISKEFHQNYIKIMKALFFHHLSK